MKKKDSIRLCHLYPDLLNLYGDRGNILALIRRSMQRDISFEVEAVSMGDAFDPKRYDMIFLGGGQDAEQNILRSDFVTGKGEDIMRAVDMNKVFLCVCGGYQMMGRYYEEHDGHRIECLGAINIWTVGKKKRFIGDTVYSCEYLTESKLLYGFENHSGRTYLGEDVKPLAKVLIGAGNNGEDGTEGAIAWELLA
jgi:CobQ-like glutamine amidotransferase family enzyme